MKPILFNTEMVMAILDGRKSVTRRVVKPQPICDGPNITFKPHDDDFFLSAEKHWLRCRVCGNDPEYSREGSSISHHWEPPYRPGDILYVRETWCENQNPNSKNFGGFEYKADYDGAMCQDLISWHPSTNMPKEAARLFLRVTGVRVERLQDITPEQARDEGCDGRCLCPSSGTCGTLCTVERDFSVERFETLWDSTIKKADLPRYGWNANSWVWTYRFERISKEEAQKGGEGNR